MKRPLLAVAAALLIAASLAGAALAAQPHHFKGTFSDSFVVPAGERCDFDERISFTLVFNDIVFGDVDDPSKVISHMKAFVSHTNLKTNYTLTELDNVVQILSFERGVGMTMGIIWKLRTPEGKLVFVQVGRVTYTLDGDVLTIAAFASGKRRTNRLRTPRRESGLGAKPELVGAFVSPHHSSYPTPSADGCSHGAYLGAASVRKTCRFAGVF